MDLFNNPMVNNALKAMTPKQIEEYKNIGNYMYGNINFEDNKLINKLDAPMEESVAYVEEGIKAGLLPEDLTEDEVALLTNAYGKEWFLRYGFKEEDVPEVGLNLALKKEMENAIKEQIAVVTNKREKRQIKKDKKNKTCNK